MAFPALPPQFPFDWATGGVVTVPSVAKRALGWIFSEAPPYDFFNWLGNRTGQGMEYLKGYLDIDHDFGDGHHLDVHVKGTLAKDAATAISYETGIGVPSTRDIIFDLGGPEKGGWTAITGAATAQFNYIPGGTPSQTSTTAGANTFIVSRLLGFLEGGQDDTVAGAQWTINQLRHRYRRNDAGDVASITIWSVARGTSAVRVNESTTFAEAVSGAAYATATHAVLIPVDPARVYWIEAIYTSNPASAAGEAGIANVDVRCARGHLE